LGDLNQAHSLFEDLKADGGRLTLDLCNNLLSATTKTQEQQEEWPPSMLASKADAIVQDMQDAGISLNEPTHANLVRRYVAAGQIELAEHYLQQAVVASGFVSESSSEDSKEQQLEDAGGRAAEGAGGRVQANFIVRRRTCSPLMVHYCNSGSLHKAIQMTRYAGKLGIDFSANEFVPLIQMLNTRKEATDAHREEILHVMSQAIETLSGQEIQQLARGIPHSELSTGSELSASGLITLVHLTDEEQKQLRSGLMTHARKQGAGGALGRFDSWLKTMDPFDTVIDCANVAWTNRRDFSFHQVDAVRKVAARHGRTLMILSSSSRNRGFSEHLLRRKAEMSLVKSWERKELQVSDDGTKETHLSLLSTTPRGMNDDLFWMYATVAPNSNAVVVSNDLMRDHHGPMGLNLRTFNRWKASKVVNFKVNPQAQMVASQRYSREMQRSPRGWHIPAAGDEDLWLTIPLMQQNDIRPEE